MKVGVIGVGRVGAACALSVVTRGSARELVLVDLNRARAKAVATDLRYGAPVCPEVAIRDGDYADLTGTAVVMITAGLNEKGGGATDRGDATGRLKLLDTNVGVYRDMIPQIVAAAPEAVLLVVTDPPDPLADLTRQLAGTQPRLEHRHAAGQLAVSRAPGRAARGECDVGRGIGSGRAWDVGGVVVVERAGEWRADRGRCADREFVRRVSPRRRAGRAIREHHDHRGQRRQPVRDRHRVDADCRSRAPRRTGGAAGRGVQFKVRRDAIAAVRRREGQDPVRSSNRRCRPTSGRRLNGARQCCAKWVGDSPTAIRACRTAPRCRRAFNRIAAATASGRRIVTTGRFSLDSRAAQLVDDRERRTVGVRPRFRSNHLSEKTYLQRTAMVRNV